MLPPFTTKPPNVGVDAAARIHASLITHHALLRFASAARVQRFVRLPIALASDQNMEFANVRRQVEMLDNRHVNTVASKKVASAQLLIMSPAGLRQFSIEVIFHFLG